MPDYTPIFTPGIAITLQASAAVEAGDLVEVTGNGTVGPAAGASPAYVGVAGMAATPGLLVTVFAGKIVHAGLADGAITAGDVVEASGVAGRQVAAAAAGSAGVIGLALTSAVDGAEVRWMQY
jgi:hypothetical protein